MGEVRIIIHNVGTIHIDGKPYRLVRTEERRQAWRWEDNPQPPWEGGVPAMLSIEESTWHLGGFKSREAIPGTSEYGTTDCRWPYQELPGPKVNTLASLGGNVYQIFEAYDYIWVVDALGAHRINPTTLDVTLSLEASPPAAPTRPGAVWEDGKPLVCEGEYRVWKLSTIGSPDTWTYTDSWAGGAAPKALARGIDRLFAVSATGLLMNVSTGLDPTNPAHYADRIQCGDNDPGHYPRSVVAYGNTVLVGKNEGLFGVSVDEGIGVPLLKRMIRGSLNCYGMEVIDPHVYVPHFRGLYRVIPGVTAESIGLEREVLNVTDISQGKFRWFASDGQWIYAGLEGAGTVHSYVLVGRDGRSGEASLGPVIWDTLVDLGAGVQTRAGCVTTWTPQPYLFFHHGSTLISYIKLPKGGGPPGSDCQFASSSVRCSPRYNFGDWNPKDFPKFEVACKGVSATRYWSFAYQIDDSGTWITTDKDGNAMDVKSLGVKTFYLAPTAVGREIQFRRTYTGPDADNAPGSIVYFKPFAVPQARKLPVITAILHCAGEMHHERQIDPRDAITQFNDLHDLSKQADSVVTYGPWTRSDSGINAWVRDVRLLETIQEGEGEPELLCQVALQLREGA